VDECKQVITPPAVDSGDGDGPYAGAFNPQHRRLTRGSTRNGHKTWQNLWWLFRFGNHAHREEVTVKRARARAKRKENETEMFITSGMPLP
jgi:hypothetical protein